MRTTDTTTTSETSLVSAASGGDAKAFTELHDRHAPLAWRLALAITGRPDAAATAVAEGTGATFTALRSGRFQAATHQVALATATRNAALDLRRGQDAITAPTVADDADPFLATAFHALPERWRSVLWLRDAEGLDAADVAPVVELTPDAVDQLAVRARRGLRERYLKALVATASSRDCTRASSRLVALEDGTLTEADRATLEGHLDGCAPCRDRRTLIGAIPVTLPALAAPVPADLQDGAKATWTSALATTSSTGLSPRTEKILAGASAFAAAVGVLGAALFGTGGGDDAVASPLAPLVADIDAPRPIDLTALALPVLEDPIPVRGDRPLTTSSPTPRSSFTGAGGELAAPGTSGGGGEAVSTSPSAPGTPAAESPSSDGSIGVGPIVVDPRPDEALIDVETPPELAPVVDPVEEIVNTIAKPVTGAAAPVLEAAEPITTGVNEIIKGIGL